MLAIDAHHHVWDLSKAPYAWMTTPAWQSIRRNIAYEELRGDLAECGVDKTILVQADNTASDGEHVRDVAMAEDRVAGFVGWVPLTEPDMVESALETLGRKLVGIRHVLSFESDDNWVLRPGVLNSLAVLEKRGLVFDLNCDRPAYLRHVPALVDKLPGLKIVVNHVGKPPVGARGWEPWAGDLARAAACPNVYAKLSGLTTPAREGWSGEDFRPYVEYAVEKFGAQRLMYASNWPVTLVAGSYKQQFDAMKLALSALSPQEASAVFGETAVRCYRLSV